MHTFFPLAHEARCFIVKCKMHQSYLKCQIRTLTSAIGGWWRNRFWGHLRRWCKFIGGSLWTTPADYIEVGWRANWLKSLWAVDRLKWRANQAWWLLRVWRRAVKSWLWRCQFWIYRRADQCWGGRNGRRGLGIGSKGSLQVERITKTQFYDNVEW